MSALRQPTDKTIEISKISEAVKKTRRIKAILGRPFRLQNRTGKKDIESASGFGNQVNTSQQIRKPFPHEFVLSKPS
jgi:RNase H-fold protein (predicted Holliday junction resolvase)